MPLSRRALLSAIFPFPSDDRWESPRPHEAPRAELVASVSTSNSCVERQGIDCRRCAEVCDHSAIRILTRERRGAVVDAAACTGCGECVPVCPVEAIALVPRERVELASEVARLVAAHG